MHTDRIICLQATSAAVCLEHAVFSEISMRRKMCMILNSAAAMLQPTTADSSASWCVLSVTSAVMVNNNNLAAPFMFGSTCWYVTHSPVVKYYVCVCRGYPCSLCANCASFWAGSVGLQHWPSCGSSRFTTPGNSMVVLLRMRPLEFFSERSTITYTRRQLHLQCRRHCRHLVIRLIKYRCCAMTLCCL